MTPHVDGGGEMKMTDDQLAEMLRKVVTEEVKRQLAFYERQLGEIVGICRRLLDEEAGHRDRDHQAVLTGLVEIERLLGIDPITSEVEKNQRQRRVRDRQVLVIGLAEIQRLLGIAPAASGVSPNYRN